MLRAVVGAIALPLGAFEPGMRKRGQCSERQSKRPPHRPIHSNRECKKRPNVPHDGSTNSLMHCSVGPSMELPPETVEKVTRPIGDIDRPDRIDMAIFNAHPPPLPSPPWG
jgi:hypothetical protein